MLAFCTDNFWKIVSALMCNVYFIVSNFDSSGEGFMFSVYGYFFFVGESLSFFFEGGDYL